MAIWQVAKAIEPKIAQQHCVEVKTDEIAHRGSCEGEAGSRNGKTGNDHERKHQLLGLGEHMENCGIEGSMSRAGGEGS